MNSAQPETPRTGRSPSTRRTGGRAWLIALIGLGIAYSPMWLPRVMDDLGVDLSPAGPAAAIAWNAIAVAALLGFVLVVERRSLRSIGLARPPAKALELALYLFGGCMAWQWLVMVLWPAPEDPGTATIAAMPIAAVVALILSAAVFEEILFRGYPIERLSELTGRRWIAFALTVPLFVAPHLVFFGAQWLWTAGVGALAIYFLYARTRSLVACMLLHLCLNLPVLIPTIASRVSS